MLRPRTLSERSRGRRSTPLAALVAALGALAAAGCAEPRPAPAYRDLVIEDALVSSLSGGDPEQLPCGFERRFARTVRAGEVLTAEVELGELPSLTLAACRRHPGVGAAAAAAGELEVTVTAGDGRKVEDAWPLEGPVGWRQRSVDLGPLAGERVTVRLEARFEGPRRLFLEQATIEHRMPAPARRGRPVQVLVISADTLRADAIGPGGGAAATPALDRLAADGELFTPHWAGATWTKPSHAELLTGHGPGVHGAVDFETPIHPSVPTLAERFRTAGFATAGLVHDCVWLDPKFGFDRGFESYRSVPWGVEQEARAAAGWMAAHRDRPFFYFLHLFEPHSDFHLLPYEAPGVGHDTVEERFGVAEYGCRAGACASELLTAINDGAVETLPNEGEILRFLYERGVERADAALGRLFADLDAAGLYEDLLIVFTSDHGEAFLEHGVVNHGHPWEEVLSVPLIVKWPRGERAGTVTRQPSGAADVAPTVLAAAGLETAGLPGADLRTRRADRPVFSGTYDRFVRVGSLKAIFPAHEAAPARLYDLADDPGERHDLAAARPGDVSRLHRLLAERRDADRRERERLAAAADRGSEPGGAALTDEERARLRALGYADGG